MNPMAENLQRCAEAILRGELVVVPTETVYGLAANALDSKAVERIYEVKRRPSWNPLIVHVSPPDTSYQVAQVLAFLSQAAAGDEPLNELLNRDGAAAGLASILRICEEALAFHYVEGVVAREALS